MEDNPQKRPDPWYQPGKHVWTTSDVKLPPERERLYAAIDREVARKGLERLHRSTSEHDRLPDAPVRERQHEREPDQDQ